MTTVEGPFWETLSYQLNNNNPIDYIFIDGHHEGQATIRYFSQIKPYLSPSAIVVFDDINWSDSMNQAWASIKADEIFSYTVDLSRIGICFVG